MPRPEKRRPPRFRDVRDLSHESAGKFAVTVEAPPKRKPWWWPTPKWWTLLVTDVAAIVGSTLVTGWDATERGMAGLAVVALATTWAKSNKTKRSSWG
jgi:hypothetical protein